MVPGYDVYQVIAQLYHNMAEQKERLARLEQMVGQVQESIRSLQDEWNADERGRPSTHVEKIEYHFDQLKVEKLEGTLNIGITPQSSGVIEQVLTDHHQAEDVQIQQHSDKPETSEIYTGVTRRVHLYLDQEAILDCRDMESQLGQQLDEDYRQMMIADVRRQIDGRIREYIRREAAAETRSKAEQQRMEDHLTERVKRDIRLSLQHYLRRHSEMAGGEKDET